MKKLTAIFVILFFVAPAYGADWYFSGSQRIATWYFSTDYGDYEYNGQDSDAMTVWYLQANSRLEAKVRADKVRGHIELAVGGGSGSNDGGDPNVRTRLAYGVWQFADNARLKVGKDYSPVTVFNSNQWFGDDGDMLGVGNFWGRRPSGLTLGVGEFELAFLTPSYGGDVGTTSTGINGATGGDPDTYIPRFEATHTFRFDAGYIRPFGGFQWYRVEENGVGNVTQDLDVYSWVLGLSTSWNIGSFTISGQASYGMNEGNVTGWFTSFNPRAASSAYLKGGDDLANVYTLQACIVPAFTVSETLRFEAGYGYRMDNADGAPGPSQPDGMWVAYLQAMIIMAPGVFLCPEVGYWDNMDDRSGNDQGYAWYAGAKWQVDF